MPPTAAAAAVGGAAATAFVAASPKPPTSSRKRSRADGEGADDCNAGGPSSMLNAARLGQVAVLRQLLAASGTAGARTLLAATDVDGRAPLALAAASGSTEAVEALLEVGAAPEATDARGWRALHAAAAGGHAGAVRALLARGADPSAADCDGCCPHHLAAAAATGPGAVAALEALLDAGAPIEASDARGWRSLHFAASARGAAAVAALLARGADAAAATAAGWRALHFSASKGDAASVVALLAASDDDAGAVEAAVADGRRPHDLAIAAGEPAALQPILSAGAARFVALDYGRAISAALRLRGERGAEVAVVLARAGAQLPSVGAARRLGREAAAVVRALRRELTGQQAQGAPVVANKKAPVSNDKAEGKEEGPSAEEGAEGGVTEEAEPTVVGVGCKRRRRQAGL